MGSGGATGTGDGGTARDPTAYPSPLLSPSPPHSPFLRPTHDPPLFDSPAPSRSEPSPRLYPRRGMDLAVLVISLVMAALFSIQTAGGIASRRPVFYALELAFLLSGALPYALGAHPGALWALRALQAPRVLRVLTAGGDYDSLHLIMGTLGAAAPLLLQALLLLVFVLLLFTAVALSVFRGASHNRCYSSILGEFEPMAAGTIMGCGGDRACPSDYPECVYGASGRTSRAPGFDNAATAMLTGYEVVTVSGWASSMNQMMDSTSWAASLWFLALVLFGAYLVANVFLVRVRVRLPRIAHSAHCALRVQSPARPWLCHATTHHCTPEPSFSSALAQAVLEVTLSKVRDQEEGVETLGGLTSASTFGTFASGFSSRKVNGYSAAAKHQSSRASATSKVAPAPGGASSAKVRMRWACWGAVTVTCRTREGDVLSIQGASRAWVARAPSSIRVATQGTNALHSMRRQSEEPRKSAPLWWLRCQEKAKSICEAPSFTNTFLTLVVINVLMLAVEHEGMSDSLESVLDCECRDPQPRRVRSPLSIASRCLPPSSSPDASPSCHLSPLPPR